MDTKSKTLVSVVVLMFVLMVGFNYHRIFIRGDYIIKMEVDCDPLVETCITRDGEDVSMEDLFYKIKQAKAIEFKDAR